MRKLLFVNACINRDISRTYRLAGEVIKLINKDNEYDVDELVLENSDINVLRSDDVNKCFGLVEDEDYSNDFFKYANQFKSADLVVAAVPYWNSSFPSIFKAYLEMISWPGVTFNYGNNLSMVGMSKAEKMYYITTRGGNVGDENDLGFLTTRDLCHGLGVKEIKCIGVDGLDIDTNDPEVLMKRGLHDLVNRL